MATVRLDTTQITNWASFHSFFKEAFGFPDFYGANMNAWIDCMSCLTGDDEGFVKLKLSENEMLHIEITETENFNARQPNILNELIECSAFVNNRYLDRGEGAKISLIFL